MASRIGRGRVTSERRPCRGALCEGVSEDALQALLAQAIGQKPEKHPLGEEFSIDAGAMSEIGG